MRSDAAINLAHRMCDELDLPHSEDHMQQAAVFAEAFIIFVERTERHGNTWKDSGWRGALFDIRKKIDRLWNEYMVADTPPDDMDSALDAINFLAFFVRARAHNIEGVWRWK